VDDDLIAHLPAFHGRADLPHDARGVGAGDVIVLPVHVKGADRLAQPGPDAVVVDARGHHQNQHLVAVDVPGIDDLGLK